MVNKGLLRRHRGTNGHQNLGALEIWGKEKQPMDSARERTLEPVQKVFALQCNPVGKRDLQHVETLLLWLENTFSVNENV